MAYTKLATVGELEVDKVDDRRFTSTEVYAFFICSYLKMQLQNMYKCDTCEMITRTGSYSALVGSHLIGIFFLGSFSFLLIRSLQWSRGIHTNEK